MPSINKIEELQRILDREKEARKLAEKGLEEKSNLLFSVSKELKTTNAQLEVLFNHKISEFQGIFENIIDAYIVINISGEIIRMNDAANNLFGDNVRVSRHLKDLVTDEYLEYTEKALQELLIKGKYLNYKASFQTKPGEEKFIQINFSLIYDNQGQPIAAHGIARDITQEIQREELLKSQKKQLDIIFNNLPIGVALFKPQSQGFIIINRSMCDMLGYSLKEFESLSLQDLTHPNYKKRFDTYHQKLINSEINTFAVEKRFVKKDNTLIWAKATVTAIRDPEGDIDYEVITLEDITKEKQASQKLKASENRLATLIVNLQTGILLEDEDRKVLLTNQKFCELFHISLEPGALTGSNCQEAAHETKHLFLEPDVFVHRIEELIKNKKITIGEELYRSDGRVLERSYIPIFEQGIYRGHLWSYDDVSLRRRYEENLKAQKEKYSHIIANMNLGLFELNNDGQIIMINQCFSEMTGYAREELMGSKAGKLLLEKENSNLYLEKSQKRVQGISDMYETRIKTKTGEIRNWLISAAPNYDVNGKITGSMGIALDVTELRSLEEKQRKLLKNLATQNEQLNDYAHIVSHDLQSPLKNISDLINWTKRDFKEKLGSENLTNLDLMQAKVKKMDHLIEGILRYSSIDNSISTRQKVDLQKVVEEIISLIYVPPHIDIRILTPLPTIEADKIRMQQLFQNIISNAVNYSDKEEAWVEITVKEEKDQYIFSIEDNGCGIPAEYHKKIFKIFSSANDNKQSTGIGLSIVKKIVDLYKGDVWLESVEGAGTTFHFSIKKF